MSPAQTWAGPVAKRSSWRLGMLVMKACRPGVRRYSFRARARSPAWRKSRPTRRRLTRTPAAASERWMRGLPYVPRLRAKVAWICSSKAASWRWRALGPRWPPRVVARASHGVERAQALHGEPLALRVEEREDLRLRAEENRMA